ncbi:MAG: hypothetical protein KJO34_16095, partial [Deltaproteobacteria bacterium]|nr:hypothetical protein [Deltaproteobacteria bacterium]
DGFEKSSNSRRTNFAIMKRTYRTLNGCEMQYNAEVGLFTKPSTLNVEPLYPGLKKPVDVFLALTY